MGFVGPLWASVCFFFQVVLGSVTNGPADRQGFISFHLETESMCSGVAPNAHSAVVMV